MSDHNEHTRQGPLGKKLTGYRKEVPAGTWEAIGGRLPGRRRSGRALVWLAAAAGIALAVTIGVMVVDRGAGEGELARETGVPRESTGKEPDKAVTAPGEDQTDREVTGGSEAGMTGERGEEAAGTRKNDQVPGAITAGKDTRLESKVRKAVDSETRTALPAAVHDRNGRLARADREKESEERKPSAAPDTTGVRIAEAGILNARVEQEQKQETPALPEKTGKESPQHSSAVSPEETGLVLPGEAVDKPAAEAVPEGGDSRRWSLGGMLAPLYTYRDAPGGYASNQIVNSAESGRLAYAGGLRVSYRSSRRLSVESGLVYNRMGLTVGGLKQYTDTRENTVGTDGGTWDNQVLTVSNSLGTIVAGGGDPVVNNYKEGDAQMDYHFLRPNSSLESTAGGTLQQTFEYLEVPLNVRYTVIDRIVDVQLVGGFSTNILVGSGVKVQDGAGLPLSGEVTEMQPVNVAGNAGIGVIYTILENLDLVVEPRVRYYLHSANSEGLPSTRPYTFGIYTGVNYAF